jgi:hypothetical protein
MIQRVTKITRLQKNKVNSNEGPMSVSRSDLCPLSSDRAFDLSNRLRNRDDG